MSEDVPIAGVPFLRIFHRDGHFIRAPGLFAFARWTGRQHIILHLQLVEAINRHATPCHPRWAWAAGEGLNELLVCLASARAAIVAHQASDQVTWHADATVWLGDETSADRTGLVDASVKLLEARA
jgi:hypothetical protein